MIFELDWFCPMCRRPEEVVFGTTAASSKRAVSLLAPVVLGHVAVEHPDREAATSAALLELLDQAVGAV